MEIDKRQRDATLAFLKSTGDMGTPVKGPYTPAAHLVTMAYTIPVLEPGHLSADPSQPVVQRVLPLY